ncbi:MAG: HAD-IB family phosphatase [Candidatus Omnitrophica bacterium]|nr:HAD-IB family phosphatase [Candidatus Omnitrophota bacterium]
MPRYKAVVFDIDGTIVKHISSWRYIHERLKLWDALACRYQELFLAGKISYKKFCDLDASHWKGLPDRRLRRLFRSAAYAKNAKKCIGRLKDMGFKLIAVSTGLQYMGERVKEELRFDYVVYNKLLSRSGVLTGKVMINISHGGKARILRKILRRLRLKPGEVISVGDSAGDIPLAQLSGYSIAFNSSDRRYSRIVDYDCKTGDFKEVFDKIVSVAGL